MLEKKYKVWDKTEKQWLELTGDTFLTYCNGKLEVIQGDDHDAREIENVEIVQYSGIKDKTKREIYEGYIIFRDYDFYAPKRVTKGVVKFIDGAFILDPCNPEEEGDYLFTEDADNIIIGNIYENPELIERKK